MMTLKIKKTYIYIYMYLYNNVNHIVKYKLYIWFIYDSNIKFFELSIIMHKLKL